MKFKLVTRFGIKLALSQLPVPKRILAIDMGSLSTGVAVSCPQLHKSYVKLLLKVIKSPSSSPAFLKQLRTLITAEEDLKAIIIGKPVHHNPEDKMLKLIDNFSKNIENQGTNWGEKDKEILYCYQDETGTSKQAEAKIREFKQAVRYYGHLYNEKDLSDGIAAINIMDRFLNYYNQS